MPRYHHTQVGWVTLGAMVTVVLLVALSVAPLGVPMILYLIVALTVAVAGIFASLSVTLDERYVTIRFGLTPIRKRIALADVASFRQVRNPWYVGWGIRYIGGGWLYNVSGFDAVELVRHGGSRLRIGTDDPDGLQRALSAALGPST